LGGDDPGGTSRREVVLRLRLAQRKALYQLVALGEALPESLVAQLEVAFQLRLYRALRWASWSCGSWVPVEGIAGAAAVVAAARVTPIARLASARQILRMVSSV
jgi:hypothetical protein